MCLTYVISFNPYNSIRPGCYYYHPHLTDEETETDQEYTAGKWQSLYPNLCSFDFKACALNCCVIWGKDLFFRWGKDLFFR